MMTLASRADRIVAELVTALNERGIQITETAPAMEALESVIVREMQAVSNEAVTITRGKQLSWIMDEIVVLTKRAWPEDAAGSRATQRSQSCQITEEHGELLGELRSLHGRHLSPEKTGSKEKVREEVGDLLFATLKMAWACEVDPVEALDVAMAKVRRRVAAMEARINGQA